MQEQKQNIKRQKNTHRGTGREQNRTLLLKHLLVDQEAGSLVKMGAIPIVQTHVVPKFIQ